MSNRSKIHHFPNAALLDWYHRVKRDLPWRETNDPYCIWLSEIILQQTRVDQGLPYYERFVERFPTVADLAQASEDEVMKLWEGLGYYSRARNLQFTAKYVHHELGGKFPEAFSELLQLKGVGPYTAAAIGSIAFGLPVAAVDGNVYRVLARYFGITSSIDETPTKRQIDQLANTIIPNADAGDHNQAMMELGATVCLPQGAQCNNCPLRDGCAAFAQNLQTELPIRSKKTKVRERFFYYVVITNHDEFQISKRGEGDIWHGLYEFPLLEADHRLDENAILTRLQLQHNDEVISISDEHKHVLSHQRIYARFILVRSNRQYTNHLRVKKDDLRTFAFPRLIDRYLKKALLLN